MKYRSEHVFRPGANELEYGNKNKGLRYKFNL